MGCSPSHQKSIVHTNSHFLVNSAKNLSLFLPDNNKESHELSLDKTYSPGARDSTQAETLVDSLASTQSSPIKDPKETKEGRKSLKAINLRESNVRFPVKVINDLFPSSPVKGNSTEQDSKRINFPLAKDGSSPRTASSRRNSEKPIVNERLSVNSALNEILFAAFGKEVVENTVEEKVKTQNKYKIKKSTSFVKVTTRKRSFIILKPQAFDQADKTTQADNAVEKPITPRAKRIVNPKNPSSMFTKVFSESKDSQHPDFGFNIRTRPCSAKLSEENSKDKIESEDIIFDEPNNVQQPPKEGHLEKFIELQNIRLASVDNTPRAHFEDESAEKTQQEIGDNFLQLPLNRFRSGSTLFSPSNSLSPKAQSKFRTNLLGLVSSNRKAPAQSFKPVNQVYNKIGFADYLHDESIVSLEFSPKCLQESALKEHNIKDLKFDEENEIQGSNMNSPFNNIGSDSPIYKCTKVMEEEEQHCDEGSLILQKSLSSSHVIEERSVYTIDDDDNISNFDSTEYVIIEEIKEVEIDEASGINIYESQKSRKLIQLHPHQSIKKSRFGTLQNIPEAKSIFCLSPDNKNHQTGDKLNIPTQFLNPASNNNSKESSIGNLSSQQRRNSYKSNRQIKSHVYKSNSVERNANKERVNQYVLLKELGRGNLGEEKLGVNGDTQTSCVVNVIDKEELADIFSTDNEEMAELQSEIALMKKINHPNVAKLYEIIDDQVNNRIYLVTELCDKNELVTAAKRFSLKSPINSREEAVKTDTPQLKPPKITEEKARKYFRDLLLGVDYIHNCANLVHGNLKPENLAISHTTLKILDCNIPFFFKSASKKTETTGSSIFFLPPEGWENTEPLKEKSFDIWSIGAILYYLLYETHPFYVNNPQGVERKVVEEEMKFPQDIKLKRCIKHLIKSCLQKDPAKRPTLQHLMEDPWVTKNWQEPLRNKETDCIVINNRDISLSFTPRFQSWPLKSSRFGRSKSKKFGFT